MRHDYDNITKFITTDNPKPFTEIDSRLSKCNRVENPGD